MIEKIFHKKKMFALIVRRKFRKKSGINFFTSKESTQQFGYMSHKKNHLIMPHKHNKRLTKILITTEVIIIFDSNGKHVDHDLMWKKKVTKFVRCGNIREIIDIDKR